MPRSFPLALLVVVASAASARAQVAANPEAPPLTPNVMLLIDTSGSMERLGGCACTTDACSECLPTCANAASDANSMNRWSTVLSALTGTYPTFTCQAQARPTTTAEPDFGYYLPHYAITSTTQTTDGILDTYANRVKFGLMTFDNIATLTTQSSLVTNTGWPSSVGASSTGPSGDYSYGVDAVFDVPGCATPFRMNNGGRNYTATNHGRLLSPGPDSIDTVSSANSIQAELLALRPYGATPTAGMLEDLEYFYNNDPSVSVFDGTNGDRYRTCRKQYVLLITDGYPNADMRGAPYYCENANGNGCPYDPPEVTAARLCQPVNGRCTGFVDGVFVIGFHVSGDPAAVARLNGIAVAGGTDASQFTTDTSDTDQAFFADDITSLKNAIEAALNQAAPDALSRATPAVSTNSSQVDLVTSTTSTVVSSNAQQSQYNAGYRVPASGPWSGVLERRRTTCNSSLTPTQQAIDDTDRFHEILDARTSASRVLYTAVPSDAANVQGYFTGDGVASGLSPMGSATTTSSTGNGNHGNGGSNCTTGGGNGNSGGNGNNGNNGNGNGNSGNNGNSGTAIGPAETGRTLVPFTWAGIGSNRAYFGSSVTSDTEAQALINWVRGDRGGRSKLGDIYHSSPVIVGRPTLNLSDESYNEFRRSAGVVDRPTMLYVGSNDGVLHAFVAETTTVIQNGAPRTYTAGTELWGFVPSFVMPMLKSASTSHVYTVDGTPYVREVFFRRRPGSSAEGSSYHTIMIVPMGLGGGAYIALDISNPFEPKFLWQFAMGAEMGTTLGAPAMAQVLVNTTTGLEERVIAMLPAGGTDALDSSTCGPIAQGDQWSQPLGCPSNGKGTPPLNAGTSNAVSRHRCWSTKGRHVYFVDPATGQAVAHLGSEVFNAPMTGGIGVYSGETGTIATRAFMADADSILWRFDLSATNPANWDAIPFADMFSSWRSVIPVGGQPAYGAPLISTDLEGQLVVVQGTGNPENFNSSAPNVVVSYTETLTYAANSTTPTIGVTENWAQKLGRYVPSNPSGNYGEQVTGPIQLFNGVVYFASYRPAVTTSNACGVGSSYIWGLDYRSAVSGEVVPRMTNDSGQTVANVALSDRIVMGVTISQQLTCTSFDAIDTSVYDPFAGTRASTNMNGTGGGAFQLLALTSGGGSTTTGSSLGEVTRTLPPPTSYSRISGIAGRVE